MRLEEGVMANVFDGDENVRDALRDRGSRFLGYLSAVSKVGLKPVRVLEPGEDVILSSDLPDYPSIVVGPGERRNAWLTVRKTHRPAGVRIPAELRRYIDPRSVADTTCQPKLNDEFAMLKKDADRGTKWEGGRLQTIERVKYAFEVWRERTWEPWVVATRPQDRAFRLYQKMFDLYLRLDQNSDYFELVFGHCVLTWEGRHRVAYPLVLTGMQLVFREDTGDIEVVPSDGPHIVLDPVDGVDLPGYGVLSRLQDRFNDQPSDLWDEIELHDLENSIVHNLGSYGQLREGISLAPTGDPVLHQGWVLALRKRADNHGRFYDALARKIQGSEELPLAFESIFSDPRTLEDIFVNEAEEETARRILTPLPANDEQRRIISRLSHHAGVTVQGPPGTGKSHTIVNLISHLLAQGKRVLVTAEKEQALAVLKDKLPDELKDFTVANIGSSTSENADLRLSIQRVQDSLANLDVRDAEISIDKLDHAIDDAQDRLASIDTQLCDLLERENSTYVFNGTEMKAEAVARLVAGDEQADIIPDRISPDTAIPLNQNEFEKYVSLCQKLDGDDARYGDADLPVPGALPSAQELANLYDQLTHAGHQVANLQNAGLEISVFDAVTATQMDDIIRLLQEGYSDLAQLDQEWEHRLGDWVCNGSQQIAWVEEGMRKASGQLSQCMRLSRARLGHSVTVPAGDFNKQTALLQAWKDRLGQGKGIPRLFNKELREFTAAITVDDGRPKTIEDLDLVRGYLEERRLLNQLGATLEQSFRGLPVPLPETDDGTLIQISDLLHAVARTLQWWREVYPNLESTVRRFFPYKSTLHVFFPDGNASMSADGLQEAIQALQDAQVRREQKRLQSELESIIQEIGGHSGYLWDKLSRSLKEEDVSLWSETLTESVGLRAVEEQHRELDRLYERLSSVSPLWAKNIRDSHGDTAATGMIEEYRTVWELAKAREWVSQLVQSSDVSDLMRESQEITKKLADLVTADAALSARLHLKQAQKPSDRRALQAWLDAIKKVGKGTGKNASRFMATARREMPHALNAMPVWIMPIHRVLDNFDPEISQPFDVIIVDESSQCDLLSVGILALAKKAIIVGDDKQTSPTNAFKNVDQYTKLQDKYIPDFTEKTLFSGDESLYAIANRAFESRILLREHFRCVPEIIEYSNRFYNGQVFPLRERMHPEIGAPLRACYVPGATSRRVSGSVVNETEARVLTDQVVACIKDPRYDGMTFGVVTLMSGSQQKIIEDMLINAIGIDEYAKRKMRVGNPPAFQGDERNVMFLSFVSDSTKSTGTTERSAQWMNVAASRAQDQLWVFYSMDVDALADTDYRKGLIEYVRDYSDDPAPDDLFGAARSEFEKDVLRDLLAYGCEESSISLHHKVGRYDIDCVVTIGAGLRLAIECDGDDPGIDLDSKGEFHKEIKKQRVLERLGWHFIRLSAPAYYSDRKSVMDPVWRYLDDLQERKQKLPEPPIIHPDTAQDHSHGSTADARPLTGYERPAAQLMEDASNIQDDATPPSPRKASAPPLHSDAPSESATTVKDNPAQGEDILELLDAMDLEYIDKRPKNGVLWVIGGREIDEEMKALKAKGHRFKFKPEGGRVTHGMPGWWKK